MKQARPLSFTVLATLFLSLLGTIHSNKTLAQEDASAQPEQALQDIQSQIKNRQSQLQARLKEAKRLQERLKNAELRISSVTQDITVSNKRIKENESEQKTLVAEKTSLLKRKNEQQKLLAKQMRSAYMSGNNDYTKMLLNQEDAGKFERMLVYYRYLNSARQKEIKQFEELVSELLEVARKLKDTNEKLQAEKAKQQQQKQTLLAQQKEREDTLVALNSVIDNEAAQIEQLQINEQNLVQALEDARRELTRNTQELTGIEPFRGKLLKPAEGRLRQLFGKRRQGQVRWKGVLFYGDSGNPIRAIHHGKVLFSDWLRGFGLMTILDHGDGYMSLYGHNQALLKQVGDYVEAGETIALLGQSGGQNQPSLYFEIRHKGQPVNPSKWLQK